MPGRLVQDLNVCNVRLVAFFSLFRGSIIKPFVYFVAIQILFVAFEIYPYAAGG